MMSWLLPCSTPSLALISGWCVIGATHRGQPWTPALMLPHMRNGLSSLLMEVFWALSQTTENRKVEACKLLIFRDPIFGFYLVWSKYSNSPSYRRLRFYHRQPLGLSSAPLLPILSVKRDSKA